jgi:hypothetical protein
LRHFVDVGSKFKCSTHNIILISKAANVLNRFYANAHWIYFIFISKLWFLCLWIWEVISMPLIDHMFPCLCHLVLKHKSFRFVYKLPPPLTPSSPVSLLKVQQYRARLVVILHLLLTIEQKLCHQACYSCVFLGVMPLLVFITVSEC